MGKLYMSDKDQSYDKNYLDMSIELLNETIDRIMENKEINVKYKHLETNIDKNNSLLHKNINEIDEKNSSIIKNINKMKEDIEDIKKDIVNLKAKSENNISKISKAVSDSNKLIENKC